MDLCSNADEGFAHLVDVCFVRFIHLALCNYSSRTNIGYARFISQILGMRVSVVAFEWYLC